MKFVTANCSIGYPVYGAKFLNNRMLLVAGGGGEGNNGIPNKLTVLRVDFAKKKVIKRFREITLDPNDDSPTTLDVANDTILMGCNENSEKIKKGEGNHHLRKFLFENEHLKFVAGIDFDRSNQPEDYTKLIYLSRDGSVGAVASSAIPTVIRIIDPKELTEKYEIETGHEVKDMHFAPDGKVISYITASTLEVISIVTGRFIIRKTDFDSNYSLSKIKFLTDDVVLIAAALKKGPGIVMIKISLRSGSATVLKTKFITNKFKGVTAMDVDHKNELAVLAGSDNSLAIVKLKDLSLGRTFKQVHSFAITRVSFSSDSGLIASVSAANTVHVIKVPENFAQSTSIWSKLLKLLLNFVFIALLAFLAQISLKYDLHNRLSKFVKDWYEERRNRAIVKREDSEQVTLVGAVSSEVPSSVVPTYSISSETISNVVEPTISFSSGLISEEKATTANDVTTKSSVASVPLITSLQSSSDQISPSAESTTKESSDSSTSTTSTTSSSASTSTPVEQNVASDSTISESESSAPTTSASATTTDTLAGISEQTAVSSLSHHGATPKSGDFDTVAEPVNKETIDEAVVLETSTKPADSVETTSAIGTTPESAGGHSMTSETLEEPSSSSQETYASSTTTTAVPLTNSVVPSSKSTTSSVETTTSESLTSFQTPTDLTSESALTASSEITTVPSSHTHEQHDKSTSLAAAEIDSTSEAKLDTSLAQTPSSSSKEVSATGSISPDDVTLEIAAETPSSSDSSSVSSKTVSTTPSSEASSVVSESSASTPEVSETSSSTFTTSIASSNTASNIPSSSITTTVTEDVSAASTTTPTAAAASVSETLTTETTSSVISSASDHSLDSSSKVSPPSETTTTSAAVTKESEPTSSDSTIVFTEEATTSIPPPVNLASDTESSSEGSDATSLSSSISRDQAKATPTSNQISDSIHSEEIVPEYGEHLQTGSKPLHTHQETAATTEGVDSVSSSVSFSQTTKKTDDFSTTSTPKVDEPTQDVDVSAKDEKDVAQEDFVEEVELNE
ncbi:ZYRO0D08382p [Zygosaccharomyces rouxii]|uniref:Guanine nucleotide-exchange factor SEC12 n=2 Tax=Zygosaccharomyces rouxii TaxID=4956 RepID=C5DVP6_ZYGRC|nr:uncharacterized protein ZYRO0D08382g [Zygosaccharomyces rouxii]KAH9200777.1 putative guanine nucleotide-exchange factor SED4 and guanine nucleotide-exchange factor SEC12 [Zygosaccharomyces rouxii]CAQ43592.1 Putative guanine nucleotide-exchange factor SED4 and Guanine nucleotide-exchange factor SEC12 [Zygosaccharomyces rouxii]CAR27865.1 ZYRO0D08382p [Zygosaccharomyces rouxii]